MIDSFMRSGYNQTLSYRIGKNEYYIVLVDSSYLDMALLRYIPKEFIQTPLNNFNVWVWVFTISAVIIIIIYSYYVYRLMHKPMLELVNSFEEVEKGNLHVSIDHEYKNVFGYLYKRFNEMTRNLRMLIDQVYNQKILMQRAELKQLQSQINPHFLYNSFFMLNTMVRINDENLIPFTKYLGEYFRYITRNASDYMPLRDEINHAKVYTNIQLIRFPRRFEINFEECPEQYVGFMVPRLIIQPIIENAFEHGIGKKSTDGFIQVRFDVHDNGLTIVVEDNGNDLSDKELAELQEALKYTGDNIEVTGILNINRRIKLVFGEESGLSVSRSELGGLKVMLKVQGGGDYIQALDS
jgi:two-component system sensor histidine kinase YesM